MNMEMVMRMVAPTSRRVVPYDAVAHAEYDAWAAIADLQRAIEAAPTVDALIAIRRKVGLIVEAYEALELRALARLDEV